VFFLPSELQVWEQLDVDVDAKVQLADGRPESFSITVSPNDAVEFHSAAAAAGRAAERLSPSDGWTAFASLLGISYPVAAK
jgi:hypothetical protein